MSSYLQHVTLSTGHVRRSPRTEVSDEVIAQLTPVIRAALGEPQARARIPGMADYRISITANGRSAMIATIWTAIAERIAPVLTFGVARTSRAGAGLWPIIDPDGLSGLPCPPAPWLAVRLEVGAGYTPPDDMALMGDLERCIAWAWLEMPE